MVYYWNRRSVWYDIYYMISWFGFVRLHISYCDAYFQCDNITRLYLSWRVMNLIVANRFWISKMVVGKFKQKKTYAPRIELIFGTHWKLKSRIRVFDSKRQNISKTSKTASLSKLLINKLENDIYRYFCNHRRHFQDTWLDYWMLLWVRLQLALRQVKQF